MLQRAAAGKHFLRKKPRRRLRVSAVLLGKIEHEVAEKPRPTRHHPAQVRIEERLRALGKIVGESVAQPRFLDGSRVAEQDAQLVAGLDLADFPGDEKRAFAHDAVADQFARCLLYTSRCV